MQFAKFRIAARGLVIKNDQLLFVSDEGKYWYLPGGRLEPGESLTRCVEREVFEETGFLVEAKELCYVQERLDVKDNLHKIHFYFKTRVITENALENWQDKDGTVCFRRFFTQEEVQSMPTVVPRFLAEKNCGLFRAETKDSDSHSTYQGVVKVRGFEMMP